MNKINENIIWENDEVIITLIKEPKLVLKIYHCKDEDIVNEKTVDITEWINEFERSKRI